jgi:hypothetical protein
MKDIERDSVCCIPWTAEQSAEIRHFKIAKI